MVELPPVGGHAFISYVREDKADADRLQGVLEAAGVRVWRDTEDLWPGQDWRAVIRRAITEDALVFLACYSGAGVAREKSYQREEVTLAIEQLRLRSPAVPWLLPVRFDDCAVPDLDLGGGRTLASIQRADLFGEHGERGLARLLSSVLRILGTAAGNGPAPGPVTPSLVQRLKALLPYEEKAIELDELVMGAARSCAARLVDRTVLPVGMNDPGLDGTRVVVDRALAYLEIAHDLSEVLVLGLTHGSPRSDALWKRAVETVARTADKQEPGAHALLALRWYPTLVLLYCATLGAVHARNWSGLRALLLDGQTRDDQGLRVPLVQAANVHAPFASTGVATDVLALQSRTGEPPSQQVIEGLRNGRAAKRYTPVSDHLHDALRPWLADLYDDDRDYDDAFDTTDVLLGLVAEDAAEQARLAGHYLHGASFGSFTWRRRHVQPPFELDVWQRHRSALLIAGFFGGSDARADAVWDQYAAQAARARSAARF